MMARTVVRASNDNLSVPSAEFHDLPEVFLTAYQRELMDWAARLQEKGPLLLVRPWQWPGSTVLSVNHQPDVTLRCDVLVHPVSGHVKMVIQPDTEADVEVVRKHCEVLPAIIAAHRAKADANKGKARGYASAVFVRIPDYFVERYGLELREWGRNLGKIGLRKHIVLREGALADASPNPDVGPVLLRVALVADVERYTGDKLGLVIRPESDRDEELIAKHCEKMQRAGIKSVAELVEPARAGVPFMPDRYT